MSGVLTLIVQDERFKTLWPYAVACLVALVASAAISTSDIRMVALLAALGCGVIVALYPIALFWTTLAVAFVIAGMAQIYFPPLELVRWALIPLSFLFIAYIFVQNLAPTPGIERRKSPNALLLVLNGFFFANVASWIMNGLPLGDFIVGLKGYFQLWGFLLALAMMHWDQQLMRSTLPKAIFLLALFEIPVALHQYFFIAPLRTYGMEKGVVALDIVAGTFGGQITGGGANAVLAVFMLAVWACVLGIWKKRGLNTFWMVVLSAILLVPVTINEAKVSIIYAVVVFLVIFRKGIFQNIGRFLTVTALVFTMVAALFYTYISHAPAGAASSWGDLVKYTVEYNLNKEEEFDGSLSRGGSIELWVNHQQTDLGHMLLGYGVGVTRQELHNNLAIDLGIANPQDYGVGKLASMAVLWESGVIGFLLLTASFAVAYFYCGQLEKVHSRDNWLSGIFVGLQGAVIILYISLWHKNFFVFHPGFQIIVITLFGFVIYWRKAEPPVYEDDEQDESDAQNGLFSVTGQADK